MIDLRAINLRLGNKRFLSGAAEESFWMHLTAQIEGLRRPGEKLDLPEYNAADAWARAYALYEALQRRAPDKQAVEAAESGRTAAAHSRLMGAFAADRQALLAYRDANRLQWSDLAEYVGISDADLVEGERDAHFGVEDGWQKKAQRLAGALSRLQGMSPAERSEVPHVVEERRRLAILQAHDRDIDTLRDALNQVLQRLEAIEIRLPTQKEVTSVVVGVSILYKRNISIMVSNNLARSLGYGGSKAVKTKSSISAGGGKPVAISKKETASNGPLSSAAVPQGKSAAAKSSGVGGCK